MPSKNKGSWRQFDSKKSGGDGGGTKGKTILISVFFGFTMLLTFILLVLSFSQISERPTIWGDQNFCQINDTQKPVRFLVPILKVPEPTPIPTSAPTTAPPPTDPPATAAPATEAPATAAPTTTGARLVRAEFAEDSSSSNDTDHSEIFKQWALHKNVVECPWPKSNSVFRIFTQFLGLATCICVFWLVMRREVWQAFWVCLIACIVLVVLNFAAFANDANTLASSRKFCEDKAIYMSTKEDYYNEEHKTIVCSLGPQVAVAVLNVIWLLWIPCTALLYLYVKSWKVVIYS